MQDSNLKRTKSKKLKIKIMQKQKGISTLVGIIIILAVAVLLFGGVFVYGNFESKQAKSVAVSPALLKQQILCNESGSFSGNLVI